LLLDRVVNLVDEGFDAAIRIGHLPDSSLTTVKLGQVRRILCASPDYLASQPPLETPADLARHRCIVFTQGGTEQAWRFADAAGRRVRVPLQSARLTLNDALAAVASATAGHGVTRVMSYQAEAELREGGLVRMLTPFEPPPVPVQLVSVARRPATARLRTLIDEIAPVLRQVLARIEAFLDMG
jgi:DNA-binding transcriptional LysR family regulator